ncbi:MAG: phosphate ABC transporter permease subunit PstC [Sphingobacteriales bacterium]|jgi:phosphate transport system permease protein
MNEQNKFRERKDQYFRLLFRLTGILTIIILGAILFMLLYNSVAFFTNHAPLDFLTGSQWNPGSKPKGNYGILPLIMGTLLVTFGAMVIAVPIGILTAAYISEFAGARLKMWLKPFIEMLSAIPSVAIGFLGIVIIGPGLAKLFGIQNGLNALNGSILLAIMSLPTIITVAEDAIHAIPSAYKEASLALGANKWETLFKVTIPAASPGLIAAVMLGLGRAIGETMTVLMATGNALAFPEGYLDPVRTITATIAIEMGEVPYQTTHYFALFAIATVLFLITLAVNIAGERIAKHYRKFTA